MGKRGFIAVCCAVLLWSAAAPVCAERGFQTDATLHMPYYSDLFSEEGDYVYYNEYIIPIPDLRLAYYWGTDSLRFGPGLRILSIIQVSVVYPLLFAELDVGPLVIHANVGGGAYLANAILQTRADVYEYLVPEISIAYRLTETVQVGTGGDIFLASGDGGDFNNVAYLGTFFLRFSF
jgi:hypothetical protein